MFPLVPAGNGPVITFGGAALLLGGPVFLAAHAPLVVFGIVILAVGGILLLLGSFIYASRHVQFEVAPEGLTIRGDLYGRRLPADALLIEAARAVDLAASPPLRPVWRTNGAGLPGYSSGWFQLGNGEKALIFITDKRRVVYLPTREGYAVLLSVPEPEKFLAALKHLAHS